MSPSLPAPSAATPSEKNSPEVRAESPVTTKWQRVKFALRAIEVRLRFIGVFLLIGLSMVYWTTFEAYWDRWTRPDDAALVAEEGSEYYCPMHPSVVRPGLEPNGSVPSCPICGMPLSKRKKGDAPELPEGVLSRVQLSPERVHLAGVKTAAASYMPLVKEIRTVGSIEYDESRQAEIVTRIGGYLEKLLVDKTFERVEAGEPLAEVYSPELYSGIQELLLAQRHSSQDLIASARQRLKLLGIGDAEIDEAVKSESHGARLLIRSPQAGQVIEKNVVQGASIEPGTVLFRVAELSTVWIEADVYERDLAFLYEGQAIEAVVDAFPGRTFAGEIDLIYPALNTETRTSRVRISVLNPDLVLRPGMFATVRVQTPVSETEPFRTALATARREPASDDEAALIAHQGVCPVTGLKLGSMGAPLKVSLDGGDVFVCCSSCESQLRENPKEFLAKIAAPPEDAVLSIPEQSVIDTGAQKVVYVEREPGTFEGVEVELGPRTGGFYPVISGLTAGDRVAAAGAFLLDAETRLNPAAASAYFGASGNGDTNSAATSATRQGAARAKDKTGGEFSDLILSHLNNLAPSDRELALHQEVCPITGEALGSMGVPVKIMVLGEPVFLCCRGCESEAVAHPDQTLTTVRKSATTEKNRAATEATSSSPAAGHNH